MSEIYTYMYTILVHTEIWVFFILRSRHHFIKKFNVLHMRTGG